MLYVPKFFKTYELVPKAVYDILGDQALLLFDPTVLITYDQLRAYFGSVVMNDYYWGGRHHERGVRLKHTRTGARYSMHKKAGAGDMVFTKVNAVEARKEIVKKRELFPYITRLEKRTAWVHWDNKPTGKKNIHVFIP